MQLIQDIGSFHAILQCLKEFLETGVHVRLVDCAGIDFSEVGIDLIRHVFHSTASTVTKQFFVAHGQHKVGGLIEVHLDAMLARLCLEFVLRLPPGESLYLSRLQIIAHLKLVT